MSLDPHVLGFALDPPRAFGSPPACGPLRTLPEDFEVEEELGFAPEGAGPHVLLQVRKREANTEWVARQLARLAGCRVADVGYAGLKHRRAVDGELELRFRLGRGSYATAVLRERISAA